MKKTITTVGMLLVLLFVTSCQNDPKVKPELGHMTQEFWQEDIRFLNDIIQDEFVSFDPSLKNQFATASHTLIENLAGLSNQDVAISIGKLVAGLKNGHTEISVIQDAADLKRAPLLMYYFADGLYIYAAHESHKNLIGDRVLAIGNQSTAAVFESLKTIMAHDNHYEILHTGPAFVTSPDILSYLGVIPNNSQIVYQLESNDGVSKEVTVQPLSRQDFLAGDWTDYASLNNTPPTLINKNIGKSYWYEYLADQHAVYFYLGQLNDQQGEPSIKLFISQMFNAIDEIKPDKLIIDLRRNSGGNNQKSRPLLDAIKKRLWLNQPGHIYVLTGRTTFSAGMAASVFLKRETEALIAGEPSRGNPNKSNNVEHVNLPHSQLMLEYTTELKKHWPEIEGSDHVPVDLEALRYFSDYKTGRDLVLESVL